MNVAARDPRGIHIIEIDDQGRIDVREQVTKSLGGTRCGIRGVPLLFPSRSNEHFGEAAE